MRGRGTATLAAFVIAISVVTTVPMASAAPGFSDVPPGAYYTQAVEWLVDQGITTGTTPTTFSPGDPITRAQMAAFLWRYGNNYGGVPHSFTDVPAGAYFDTAVGWLLLHEITTGTTPTTYAPGAGVTRAQMAVFLWRYAGQPAPSTTATFTDVPSGAWFTDAVSWLVEQGITTGTTATTFSPDRVITRAQMATFLWRYAGQPTVGSPGINRDPALFDCAFQTSIPTTECKALVAIKHAYPNGLADWIAYGLYDWVVEPDPAAWYGVTVTAGTVTDLDFSGQPTLTLPPEIGNLTNLTTLDLYDVNSLSPLPAEIGNLTALTSLTIFDTIEGSWSDTFGSWSLPAEIWNLTNLTNLLLGGIQLTTLPPEIGNLTNLTDLTIVFNQLTSTPPEIGNLTNLTRLNLTGNQLTSVPTGIGNLTNLTNLYLSTNQLTSVPTEIGNLTNLTTLWLYNNQLTSVPVEMMNLTNLTDLGLSGQATCLSVADAGFAAWLASHDTGWNDGCP